MLQPNVGCFLSSGYDDESPVGTSYKIWLMTALVTAVLLHVYYGAFLVTIFATPTVKLPINNLQELHDKRDEWTLGLEVDSFAEQEFQVKLYRKLFHCAMCMYVSN